MPLLSTYCGRMSQKAFRKHLSECGICWAEAQGRDDLVFDAARVCDPRLPDKQETVCLACNEIVFVEAKQDIQGQECDDCQRTGTLILIAEYNKLSVLRTAELRRRYATK